VCPLCALTDQDKQWISLQLERVETKLLTAFHTWRRRSKCANGAIAQAIRALDAEMEALQDPVKNLEQPPS
jgi:hypothetical protein